MKQISAVLDLRLRLNLQEFVVPRSIPTTGPLTLEEFNRAPRGVDYEHSTVVSI